MNVEDKNKMMEEVVVIHLYASNFEGQDMDMVLENMEKEKNKIFLIKHEWGVLQVNHRNMDLRKFHGQSVQLVPDHTTGQYRLYYVSRNKDIYMEYFDLLDG